MPCRLTAITSLSQASSLSDTPLGSLSCFPPPPPVPLRPSHPFCLFSQASSSSDTPLGNLLKQAHKKQQQSAQSATAAPPVAPPPVAAPAPAAPPQQQQQQAAHPPHHQHGSSTPPLLPPSFFQQQQAGGSSGGGAPVAAPAPAPGISSKHLSDLRKVRCMFVWGVGRVLSGKVHIHLDVWIWKCGDEGLPPDGPIETYIRSKSELGM